MLIFSLISLFVIMSLTFCWYIPWSSWKKKLNVKNRIFISYSFLQDKTHLYFNVNKGNAKHGVSTRLNIWPGDLDLLPWKSIGFQILLRTKYVPSLVKIHWRMLILVFTRMLRKDGSITISLRNFVGEGLIIQQKLYEFLLHFQNGSFSCNFLIYWGNVEFYTRPLSNVVQIRSVRGAVVAVIVW